MFPCEKDQTFVWIQVSNLRLSSFMKTIIFFKIMQVSLTFDFLSVEYCLGKFLKCLFHNGPIKQELTCEH